MIKQTNIFLQLCILISCAFSCKESNSTKEEGFRVEFYDNDVLKRKYEVQNNLLHGEDSSFYKSGNLKSRFQWYDSVLFKEGYEYFDETSPMLVEHNGDTFIIEYPKIKSYYEFNSYGSIGFEVQFDKNQSPTNVSGDAIVSIYQDTINHRFTLYVSNPPYLTSELIVKHNYNYDTTLVKNNVIDLEFDTRKCQVRDSILIYHYIKDSNKNVINTDEVRLKCIEGRYKLERRIKDPREI